VVPRAVPVLPALRDQLRHAPAVGPHQADPVVLGGAQLGDDGAQPGVGPGPAGRKQLDDKARKLLSFTDNRQDASLQAGHFNDFVEVALQRGALYQAVAGAGEEGLAGERLVQATFRALQLDFAEYAADPVGPGSRRAGRPSGRSRACSATGCTATSSAAGG
jgi:hypothetical protein